MTSFRASRGPLRLCSHVSALFPSSSSPSLYNFWSISNKKSELKEMMADLAEKLRKMGMEQNQESLWWTSTCGKAIKCHMTTEADNESWTSAFCG